MNYQLAEINAEIAKLQELKAQKLEDMIAKQKSMTKEEKIAATWKLPELTLGHWDMIKDRGFKTGSVVYGDPATANDEDWCVNIHPRFLIGHSIGAENTDYFETDGMQPLYCHYKGQLINVICFSDFALMMAWYQATQYMQIMRNNWVKVNRFQSGTEYSAEIALKTKWSRVRIFRALVDALWPVKPLWQPLGVEIAKKRNVCTLCGRKANNFMNMQNKQHYEKTQICERCM